MFILSIIRNVEQRETFIHTGSTRLFEEKSSQECHNVIMIYVIAIRKEG